MSKDCKVLRNKSATVSLLKGHSIKLLSPTFLSLYSQIIVAFRSDQRSFFEEQISLNIKTPEWAGYREDCEYPAINGMSISYPPSRIRIQRRWRSEKTGSQRSEEDDRTRNLSSYKTGPLHSWSHNSCSCLHQSNQLTFQDWPGRRKVYSYGPWQICHAQLIALDPWMVKQHKMYYVRNTCIYTYI